MPEMGWQDYINIKINNKSQITQSHSCAKSLALFTYAYNP